MFLFHQVFKVLLIFYSFLTLPTRATCLDHLSQYSVKRTNYEASYYAFLSIMLLFHPFYFHIHVFLIPYFSLLTDENILHITQP